MINPLGTNSKMLSNRMKEVEIVTCIVSFQKKKKQLLESQETREYLSLSLYLK